MDILISFCNTSEFPGFPNLGILNTGSHEYNILEISDNIPQTGMVGMKYSSKYIFIGLQHVKGGLNAFESPPALLVFDKVNFQLLLKYEFRLAKDIHSFLLRQDERTLLVASTGTDDIIELELNEFHVVSEKVFMHLGNGDRMDNHHVNSICEHQNEIYVTAFGEKEHGRDWTSARNGYVMNLSNGDKLVEGLEHPHSLTVINGELAFCESRKQSVRFVNDNISFELSGYTRGLCLVNGKLFVATSSQRKKSKSTGKLVTSAENENAGCTISIISLGNFKIEETVDLNDYGFEIYELLALQGNEQWPVRKAENYRQLFEHSWFKRAESALDEIQNAIPKNEVLLLVDENILQIRNSLFPEHTVFPFLEKDGIAWGAPENDEEANIELLRMQREKGAKYLAFAWPAFWWFDTYPRFAKNLRSRDECVVENENVAIFKLGAMDEKSKR